MATYNDYTLAIIGCYRLGVNSVLKAFPWQKGDEILATVHTYKAVEYACRKAAQFSTGKAPRITSLMISLARFHLAWFLKHDGMARELGYESSRVESSAWSSLINRIILFIRVF